MEEKRQEISKSIFLEVGIHFLINALEDLKKDSINKDSSVIGRWTQDTSLSKNKRAVATNAVIALSKFQPRDNDEHNKTALEHLLATCREQAKNLSFQAGHKDEGTFGPAMQKIELFLKQFYDTLVQSSGYCLLKVKTSPLRSYEQIEILTGIQKTIIFCENEEKFYYKDTINKIICYIESPTNIDDNQSESVLLAHKSLTESFQDIPCDKYRKASQEELEHIFLITDKKACQFLDTVYNKSDAYSLYLYHMAYYFAQTIYDGTSTGLIKKFVRHFVPEIDKAPEIIDKLEQCNADLIMLNTEISNYQAGKVKIVLGSLKQLETGNKTLVQEASYEPKIKVDLKIFSSITFSSDKITSSEGRLGDRIKIAMEEIKLSNRKILSQVEKIKISNQTPLILNSNNFGNSNTMSHGHMTLNKSVKITRGIKVLPEYPQYKTKSNHNQQLKSSHQPIEIDEEEFQTSNQMMSKKMPPNFSKNTKPEMNSLQTKKLLNMTTMPPSQKIHINKPLHQHEFEISDQETDTDVMIENNILYEVPNNQSDLTNFEEQQNTYVEHDGDNQMYHEGDQSNESTETNPSTFKKEEGEDFESQYHAYN